MCTKIQWHNICSKVKWKLLEDRKYSRELLMAKGVLMQQIYYPSFLFFSYDPIPSGAFAFLFRFLKIALKLFIIKIKYRLRFFS